MSSLIPVIAGHLPRVSTAFVAACLVLAVTPGPGVLYIVARSASQGRAAGLLSAAAIAVGNLANGAIAAFGLAALFAVSAAAFTAVKYCGALYLIYLGVRTIRAACTCDAVVRIEPGGADLARVFLDGALVALLNPKTAIFFAAFVPQFLDPTDAGAPAALGLSAIFVAIAAATDCLYALTASSGRWWTGRTRRSGRLVSGSVLIALGLFTAVSGRRASL